MIFSYNKFLRPITTSDNNIQVLDNTGSVVYTINPFSVGTTRVSNNVLEISFKSGKIIPIPFSSINESKIALGLFQSQIDTLLEKTPTLIDVQIKNYIDYIVSLRSSSGTSGSSGSSGTSGSSGSSGVNGMDGTFFGSSGTSGANGSSGTSGANGSSGTSGANGSSGTSGANGLSGTSGVSSSYSATSSTTIVVPSAGYLVNFDTQDSLAYTPGQSVIMFTEDPEYYVVDDYTDAYGHIIGKVNYYNVITGSMSVVADYTESIGNTYSYWHINLTGDYLSIVAGATGVNGSSGTSGTSGIGSSGTSGVNGSSGTSGSSGVSSNGPQNYIQVLGPILNGVTTIGTTIISGTISTTGGPVHVTVTGDANPSGATSFVRLQLYRNSTPIGKIVHAENGSNLNVPYCVTYIDNPSAGTYSYSMRTVSSIGGTMNFGEADGPTLTMVELTGSGTSGSSGTSGNSVSASYMRGSRSTQQTTNLTVNSLVAFTQIDNSTGSDVSLNTSTGQITLAANRTYRLMAQIPNFTTSATSSRPSFCWYNETSSTYIGSGSSMYSARDQASFGAIGGLSEAIITTTQNTIVSYRILSLVEAITGLGGSDDFNTTGSYPWFDIEVISGHSPLVNGTSGTSGTSPSTDLTLSGNLVVNGQSTFTEVTEVINSTPAGATASIVTYDFSSGNIWYHGTASQNYTANFINVPTTNWRTITTTVVIAQGGTAYIPTSVRVNGTASTVKWAGGTASGSSSKVDIIGFSFIYTNSGIPTQVLGQINSFN